jgi:hypothetical protein
VVDFLLHCCGLEFDGGAPIHAPYREWHHDSQSRITSDRAKSIPNLSFVSADASRLPSLLLHNGLIMPNLQLSCDKTGLLFIWRLGQNENMTIYETDFI